MKKKKASVGVEIALLMTARRLAGYSSVFTAEKVGCLRENRQTLQHAIAWIRIEMEALDEELMVLEERMRCLGQGNRRKGRA